MLDQRPVLLWVRRDFRLSDNPALLSAVATGAPVIPVFLYDELVENLGSAPKFRLGLGAQAFAHRLEQIGSRLILRRGPALPALKTLIAETGATAVFWSRLAEPEARERDEVVKAALKAQGLDARSFPGHLLFEPWTVETKTGGFYRVYSPMWKAVRGRDVGSPCAAPKAIRPPAQWPVSEDIASWNMARAMGRGVDIVAPYQIVGEIAAQERLAEFAEERIDIYKAKRDFPSVNATSGLSENLTYGEISPLQCWAAGHNALERGSPGAETFLKELVWREFAYHLAYHTPHITTKNWRPEWDAFPWNSDPDRPEVVAWKQGRTGIPFVDAAMREMYVTGTMHNRARMIVASYLCKHLMAHWKIGKAWFADCLTDWDPASNAMGWQWTAGSGPDAAPYFRVFNPVTQLVKFDGGGAYAKRWIAEGQAKPSATALSYFQAIPKSWNMSASARYYDPVVTLEVGRARALEAYSARKP